MVLVEHAVSVKEHGHLSGNSGAQVRQVSFKVVDKWP